MIQARQLHINAFLLGTGHHEGAWRLPGTQPENVLTAEHYVELARIAERGKLDSIFFADQLAVGPDVRHYSREGPEPLTLLAAISMATRRIGLVATASTTYNTPYDIARRFASLDHISHGRAGWNIVTSALADEALNFMRERAAHLARYDRAVEFVETTLELWDSWEDDARVINKAAGVYVDPAKVHPINHDGQHFFVRGPLNVPRSPSGRPVLFQAGSSEEGRQVAARFADAIFTGQTTLETGKAFYADLKRRAEALGRDPNHLLILPGMVAIVAGTEAEAQRIRDETNEVFSIEFGVALLSRYMEQDMSVYPLDEELPPLLGEDTGHGVEGGRTRFAGIVAIGRREKLTIRQLVKRLSGGSGHLRVTGTPDQVADVMATWFRSGAADGFNMVPQVLPASLEAFVDQVVPELQRRGLFRTEYTGDTLRDHYGLPRPTSLFAPAAGPGVPIARTHKGETRL